MSRNSLGQLLEWHPFTARQGSSLPEWLPGLYVAAGHFRSGIHLSPATAMLIADLLSGRPTEIDIDPFRVGKQQHRASASATIA